MAGNGPREAAAAGQVPAVSASKRNYSAAAASGLQAGVVTEVAAPATPRDRPTSTLLGSVGASGSTSARRYRGKRPPPSPAAGATPHGSAAQRRLRGKNSPNLFRPEELYFEAQEDAWCGMHAVNNYRLGPCISKEQCRQAAHTVVRQLGAGNTMSEHLDPLTGWLSIDVLNVLGDVELPKNGHGLQVAPVSGDSWRLGEDAMVNWNNHHWTVLQADPSGDGWMHTNSIRGPGPVHGRRRRLAEGDVDALLDAIRAESGAVTLHALTPCAGGQLLPAAPATDEEMEDGEGGHGGEGREAGDGHAAQLSLVTVNVDGLGDHYDETPSQRMVAILRSCLAVEPAPDALLFQEMTHEMLIEARSGLPEWRCCKRGDGRLSEDYFNVTFLRDAPARTSSVEFPSSRNGRHVVIAYCGGWVIQNTHVESGGNAEARDAREAQIRQLSGRHRQGAVAEDAVCVLAGDFNLRAEEERPLLNEGWRDAWQWPGAAPGEDWTWSGHGHQARYDRVFVHDGQEGAKVQRQSISRLSGIWPALSDHVALHAVFLQLPGNSAKYKQAILCTYSKDELANRHLQWEHHRELYVAHSIAYCLTGV